QGPSNPSGQFGPNMSSGPTLGSRSKALQLSPDLLGGHLVAVSTAESSIEVMSSKGVMRT
ncbi:hypothetical protein, partial [Sphingomonas sp. Ag1]